MSLKRLDGPGQKVQITFYCILFLASYTFLMLWLYSCYIAFIGISKPFVAFAGLLWPFLVVDESTAKHLSSKLNNRTGYNFSTTIQASISHKPVCQTAEVNCKLFLLYCALPTYVWHKLFALKLMTWNMSLYSETFSTLKPFKRRPTYDLLIAFKGNKTKLLFYLQSFNPFVFLAWNEWSNQSSF